MSDADAAVLRAFRAEYGRTVAVLVRMLGDLDAAEDAVQEAFTAAAGTWAQRGVPPNPQGWIVTTARNRAIDRLRREDTARRYTPHLARPAVAAPADDGVDDELRLVFLCCHPALSAEAQVALTLRFVGGLTTAEIARAFAAPEATIAQRLTRAKAKVRQASMTMRLPEPGNWGERMAAVLAVVYGIYNEGYLTTTGALVRHDLADKGVHLARQLFRLAPGDPEARGLLALLLLLDARRAARVGSDGELITLPDQDRGRWRPELIDQGQQLVRECLAINQPGPYQLQAAIQAVHCDAPRDDATDWTQILTLYNQLLALLPTAAVATSRAVAVGKVLGPHAALTAIEAIEDPDHYTDAVTADLLHQLGHHRQAADLFSSAATKTRNHAEQAHLQHRAHDANPHAPE